ncbi:MAG: hypothetical protein HUU55_13095 [Myxococcales bacterium]|nr:hypothetical protein [Myxococcales bacterium]
MTTQDELATIYAVVDQVDPFWNDDGRQLFDEAAMRALANMGNPELALLQVATSGNTSLRRRFGAVEALFQGQWTQFRHDPLMASAVAHVMAAAIADDGIHNRWGLPGHFVGRTGKHLLSLPHGIITALSPLLDNNKLLEIVGSETATTQTVSKYRVADLAAYLLSIHLNLPWVDSPKTMDRDRQIAELKKNLAKKVD